MGQNMGRGVNRNKQEAAWSFSYERGRRPNTETPTRPFDPWELFDERIRTGPFSLDRTRVRINMALKWPLNSVYRLPVHPFSPIQWANLEDDSIYRRQGDPRMSPALRTFVMASPIHRFQNSGRRLTPAEVDTAMRKLKKEIYWPSRKTKGKGSSDDKDCDHTSCPICLDEFVVKQQLLRLPCNHRFLSDCLMPWIKSHALCPICRFDLSGRPPENSDVSAAAAGTPTDDMLIRAMEEAFDWISSHRR